MERGLRPGFCFRGVESWTESNFRNRMGSPLFLGLTLFSLNRPNRQLPKSEALTQLRGSMEPSGTN